MLNVGLCDIFYGVTEFCKPKLLKNKLNALSF